MLSAPPFLVLLARIFLLSFAYVIAGRLSLLLAIPPGFATAVFPPLGISVAAVLLWGNPLLLGVFIGSLILNASIAITSGADLTVSTIIVAAEIAFGSCLATWTAASLVRKFIGFPNALMDEWSIFLFFILCGPVASSVSATVGVATLCLNGLIPLSHIVYSWVTWWTGDAMGVLIAAPIMFIIFAHPRGLWKNRAATLGGPLVISCALIVGVFINATNSEQQKIQHKFENDATEIANKLFAGFAKHIDALTPLKGLYNASNTVTAENFRIFTSELLTRGNGITALAWDEKVLASERPKFEQRLISEGFNNFYISEQNDASDIVSAQERDSYIVVTYVEPYAKNNGVHGFDVKSEAARCRALEFANKTGMPAMTSPLQVVQMKNKELSYLIFMPVYKTLDVPKTTAMREQLLRGYVTALVRVSHQIDAIRQEFSVNDFAINLTDVTDIENPVTIYEDRNTSQSLISRSYTWTMQKNVAGRDISLVVTPTSEYIDGLWTIESWYVLVGGLLFCSLLGGFLLLVTGRTQYISSLVEQRTSELESILAEAVEAIIIVNQNGVIERANPAACRLFRINEDNLIGSKSETIIPLLRELLFIPDKEYSRNTNRSIWKAQETLGLCSDNTKIPIEIGVSRVDLPDRRIYTCLIHDIAARKKVDKLKNEFVSTVSHELRTPLTSITGALGLLVGGAVPQIPIKAMDLLIIAKNNAERLGRLVNDILDIEKLEFGKLQLDIADCDVNDLMQQSIDQNTGYATKYGVNLELDKECLKGRQVMILVDPDRFLQVMSNLISNAVKFSSMAGTVTVSVKIIDGDVIFYIEDHGCGIPDEFHSKIFQKFAQADSSDTRKRDGTGLGLSISRVIVERMGGSIGYTSEINKGSIFFFSIPVEDLQ